MKLDNSSVMLSAEEKEYAIQKQEAPKEAVDFVLAADEASIDGRSQWMWIRLPNGDLFLGIYPQGDTYFSTEQWRTI